MLRKKEVVGSVGSYLFIQRPRAHIEYTYTRILAFRAPNKAYTVCSYNAQEKEKLVKTKTTSMQNTAGAGVQVQRGCQGNPDSLRLIVCVEQCREDFKVMVPKSYENKLAKKDMVIRLRS